MKKNGWVAGLAVGTVVWQSGELAWYLYPQFTDSLAPIVVMLTSVSLGTIAYFAAKPVETASALKKVLMAGSVIAAIVCLNLFLSLGILVATGRLDSI